MKLIIKKFKENKSTPDIQKVLDDNDIPARVTFEGDDAIVVMRHANDRGTIQFVKDAVGKYGDFDFELTESETGEYPVPTMAVKPYPGDKGYPLVKKNYHRFLWMNPKLGKKKRKLMENIIDFEGFINEENASHSIMHDSVLLSNHNYKVNIEWYPEWIYKSAGVEGVEVMLKSAEIDGESVDVSKADISFTKNIFPLYAKQAEYNFKTGVLKIVFGS